MIDIVNYAKDKNQGGNTYNYTSGPSSSSSSLSFVTRDEYSKLQTLLKMFEPGYFDNNVWTPISNVSGLAGRNWSIKALRDLWGVGGMTALGTGGSSGGGGGGGVPLGNLLNSLNSSQAVGSITPGQSQAGKVLQFDGSDWSFVTVGSSELSGVVSVSTGTGLTGGPITSSGTISINDTYQGYIQKGVTAYGWGDHSQAGYLTSAVTSVKLSEGTGIDIDSTAAITSTGERTISINSTYQGYITQGVTAYGWGNHATAGYQPAINDLATIRNNASNGATAYGWGNHASAGYATDSGVVHKAGAETISGQKTFTASLVASNDIYLNKSGQQQWLNFNNGTKNFSFGQEAGGDCVLYADGNVNFYTNVNGNPYSLFVKGNGNVGIGTSGPSYKLDVNGAAHAADAMWSDTSIGVTNRFRLRWDNANNTVWVEGPNGEAVNFSSKGGLASLGSTGTGGADTFTLKNLTANPKLQFIADSSSAIMGSVSADQDGWLKLSGYTAVAMLSDLYMNQKKIYFNDDSGPYLYVSGTHLYYNNGVSSTLIA